MAKIVPASVYVLLEDGSTVLPGVECRFITQEELQNLPKGRGHYVVTANGVYVQKSTGLIEGCVQTEHVPFLSGELDVTARLNMAKIPSLIIARSLTFFRQVFRELNSECELLILYDPKKREYELYCPNQEVSHGSVDHTNAYSQAMEEVGDTWKIVGTIHSHCDFGAFHSGTDTSDEADQDGVHITLGHVPQQNFSMVSSAVVNGNRWQIPPEHVIRGVSNRTGEGEDIISTRSDSHYTLRLTEDEQELLRTKYLTQIVKEWLPKVKKRTYQASKWTNWTQS